MKYIFFGSPRFAEIILEKLIDASMPPAAVICNPDRPFGRKKVLTPPPVKVLAQSHGIPVLQPEKLDEGFKLQVSGFKPDFAVVAAYAKILPQSIIGLPRLGTIGVHPSLLPRYRGASPIQSVILSGEAETGVTLFMLDEKVDHGALLATRALPIAARETYETLLQKLGGLSGELLADTLPRFVTGNIAPRAQNEDAATYTKKFSTENGFVDFAKDDPAVIDRKIRALTPDPGVYTLVEKKGKRVRLKLLEAEIRDGCLVPTLIQYEGGKQIRP
ncbi:MAG: methionyl-tRNA formyltransferase [bacterium]|nr:methionyl-tRNA formyltransferase [bacterium]